MKCFKEGRNENYVQFIFAIFRSAKYGDTQSHKRAGSANLFQMGKIFWRKFDESMLLSCLRKN